MLGVALTADTAANIRSPSQAGVQQFMSGLPPSAAQWVFCRDTCTIVRNCYQFSYFPLKVAIVAVTFNRYEILWLSRRIVCLNWRTSTCR